MSPRTLFNIILKIIGLLFVKDILALIPQISSVILAFENNNVSVAIWILSTTLLILAAYWLVAYYLIFRTELVIDKFSLDKDFPQETISLNVHRSTVLSISIIVIGGLLLADSIPELCRQIFYYFQEKRLTYGQTQPRVDYMITSVAKVILGLVLIGSQRQIVNLIERQRKK
jgi:hypothetical protein